MTGTLFPEIEPGTVTLRWVAAPRFRLSLVREPGHDQYDAEPCREPDAAAKLLAGILADEPAEAMAVAFLDSRHRIIGTAIPYRGTMARASVEPRGLLVPALLANAAAILIAHNHPSGDPTPSAEDVAFTRRLAEAGEVVGVRLLDHIIVAGPSRWLSLRQRGAW